MHRSRRRIFSSGTAKLWHGSNCPPPTQHVMNYCRIPSNLCVGKPLKQSPLIKFIDYSFIFRNTLKKNNFQAYFPINLPIYSRIRTNEFWRNLRHILVLIPMGFHRTTFWFHSEWRQWSLKFWRNSARWCSPSHQTALIRDYNWNINHPLSSLSEQKLTEWCLNRLQERTSTLNKAHRMEWPTFPKCLSTSQYDLLKCFTLSF